MIVEKFGQLPPYIFLEGCIFELNLIVDGRPSDVRLVYRLQSVEPDSPHEFNFNQSGCWENPFADENFQGFLFLRQNISNDAQLIQALDECVEFMEKNNLL